MPEANLQTGLVGPNAIAHRKVATGAVPRANLQKGRAEPNTIAHRKVAAGAEPNAHPDKRRAKPDAIALQEPKRAHQRVKTLATGWKCRPTTSKRTRWWQRGRHWQRS